MKQSTELASISLQGDRQLNQDRSFSLSKDGDTLLVLGDGLGGHPRGEVAAQLLVDTCEHVFRNAEHPAPDPLGLITECLERAHAAIVRFGLGQQPPISPRTTGVVCLVQNREAWWCHVGDSRLYLFRNGGMVAHTEDHTQRRARDGAPGTRVTITRCLGGLNLPPDLAEHGPTPLLPGDTLLLCSDGFWAQLDDAKVGKRLYAEGELNTHLATLADEACKRAHPRSDNTTAVALRWWPATAESNQPALGSATAPPGRFA